MVYRMYFLDRSYIKKDVLEDHFTRIIKNQYSDFHLPNNLTDSILKISEDLRSTDSIHASSKAYDARFVLEIGCVGVSCLFMLMVFFFRFRQIRLLPDSLGSESPFSLKTRVFMLTVLILANLAPIPLTFLLNIYAKEIESLRYFNLIYLLFAFTYCFQIWILKMELTKKVPIFWIHKMFWLILLLFHVCITAQDVQDFRLEGELGWLLIVIDCLRTGFLLLLSIYSLLIRPQDVVIFDQEEFFMIGVPLLNDYPRIAEADVQNYIQANSSGSLYNSFSNSTRYVSLKNEYPHFQSTKISASISNRILRKSGSTNDIRNNKDIYFYEIHISVDTLDDFNRNKSFQIKIERTLTDFFKLEKKLLESTAESKLLKGNEHLLKLNMNTKSSGQGKSEYQYLYNCIATLQSYLNDLLSTPDIFSAVALIKFLEIPTNIARKLNTTRKKIEESLQEKSDSLTYDTPSLNRCKWGQGISNRSDNWLITGGTFIQEENDPLMTTERTPVHEDDEEHSYLDDEKENQRGDQSDDNEEDEKHNHYCPYFGVRFLDDKRSVIGGNHLEYTIEIVMQEMPEQAWKIEKRYSDFNKLDEQLKKRLSLKPPELPGKILINYKNGHSLKKRREKLENYLRIILNEKVYFNNEIVFKFIGLKERYYDIFLMPIEELQFHSYKAKIIDHFADMNDKKPYTLYRIAVEKQESLQNLSKKILNKRYSDFEKLHKSLQVRFFNSSCKLPEVPPKISPFGKRTTIDFRKQELENYLNQLFKLPDIGDCFEFRRFIQFTYERGKSFIKPFKLPRDNEGAIGCSQLLESKPLDEKQIEIDSLKIDMYLMSKARSCSDHSN